MVIILKKYSSIKDVDRPEHPNMSLGIYVLNSLLIHSGRIWRKRKSLLSPFMWRIKEKNYPRFCVCLRIRDSPEFLDKVVEEECNLYLSKFRPWAASWTSTKGSKFFACLILGLHVMNTISKNMNRRVYIFW